MSDVTLQDGRELSVDLNKITIIEYRGIFDKNEPEDKSDEAVARTVGLSLDEIKALGFLDYRKVMDAFFNAVKQSLKMDSAKN